MFSMWFSALFLHHPGSPDVVEFNVVLAERDAPVLVCADVIWGDGSGAVDLYFADDELLLRPEVVEELVRALPRFRRGMVESVERRQPRDVPLGEGIFGSTQK